MAIIDLSNDPVGGLLRKPESNPTNWQFSKLRACASETQESIPIAVSLKSKFPKKILKQTCGNCTSNAVLNCDGYYYHSSSPKWEPSTIFTYYVQRDMNGDPIKEDTGSYVEVALDAVRKKGACSATVWPNTKPFKRKPSKEAYANGLKGREITKYYQIKSLLQLKKALAKGYPVAAAFVWPFTSVDGNTWILCDPDDDSIKYCESQHAVAVVGYDDDKQLIEIRNSWGPQWCNKGYAYMTYNAAKKCLLFDDTYAVVK